MISKEITSKGSGFSAVGSAHVWGARGRWFESSNPDRGKKQIVIKDLKLLFLFQGNELMRFLFV